MVDPRNESFDDYCDRLGVFDPAEFPAAFAAYLNQQTGWDGDMNEVFCGHRE
jgi:hypothetical protein